MSRIVGFHSLNKKNPLTCGSCKHTDNDLGLVALRCDIIYEQMENDNELLPEDYDFAKVRSWHECHFNPSKWERRKGGDIV